MPQSKGSYEVDRLAEMIEGLDEVSKEVLVLRFKHDMSHADVASDLGLSVDDVHRIEASALRKLREEMNTP
jgi:RNA polymerase sigma factor (sigma-70 family)